MRKINALLFDLDGTLIDSASDITRCLNVVLKSFGFSERRQEEVKRFIGDGVLSLLGKATGSSDSQLIEKMAEKLKNYYAEHFIEETVLYPQVGETLNHFRGKKMAVISNKPSALVAKTIEHFSLNKFFQVVFGAESTLNRKPHPEPILKVLEILAVCPPEALVIGDGTTDILSGKSAGTLTCAVTYGYRPKEELLALGPDFVINSFEELKEIII